MRRCIARSRNDFARGCDRLGEVHSEHGGREAEARVILHHARPDDGTILTRVSGDEPIHVDPAGIVLHDPLPPLS